MRNSTSIAISSLFHVSGSTLVAAADDDRHRFEWDDDVAPPHFLFHPETIKDCTFWYNPEPEDTCEEVLEMFGSNAAEFARWNPSITGNCGNWNIERSYCVEVRSEWPTSLTFLWDTPTTTADEQTSTTTTAGPPYGTPTWEAVGCYIIDRDSDIPVMGKRITAEGGDSGLTVSKCQEMCFDDDWELVFLAGLEGGNTCWCSEYIVTDTVEDADCNIPCAGNEQETCGGEDLVFVYQAGSGADLGDTTTMTESTTSSADQATSTGSSDSSQPTDTSEGTNSIANDTDNGAADRDTFGLCGRIMSTLAGLVLFI